ncbi:MAG: FAD-binding oxidoreductase [Azospirillaceae bacterium]|nr:FAD-binding oxidoreductase [Azospirillaceae bacterium]
MTEWGTHGLWAGTAPAAPETIPLAGDRSADVVIIGAGYTGLSAALHLAEAGTSVVLLEAEEIGFGGSGRNTGLVNAGLWLTPSETVARLGHERGGSLLELLGNGPREVFALIHRFGIDCELETNGTLHCAVGRAGLAAVRERTDQWAAIGAPVEFLDATATAAKIGTTTYAGSLWDHRAGTIQPLAYARGLAGAALGAGAKIHTKSRVTGFTAERDGWTVRTAVGTVRASWLILATNGYTNRLAPEIRREMVMLPYFNLATAPLAPELLKEILPERQGTWNTLLVPTSIRRDRAGRLLLGSVGAGRFGGQAVHRAWAERELQRIFPQLPRTGFESGWHGVIGMTRDDLPKLRRLGPNGLSISGCNGRGIAPGTVYGRTLAEHILGRRPFTALPLEPTAPAPIALRGFKEAYYETGAQVAHSVMGRLRPRPSHP